MAKREDKPACSAPQIIAVQAKPLDSSVLVTLIDDAGNGHQFRIDGRTARVMAGEINMAWAEVCPL